MLSTLFLVLLMTALPRESDDLVVGRLSVNTSHPTSIIYYYAGAAFPEGEPLMSNAVECFAAELKATGLFTDVTVTMNPNADGRTVDLMIEPIWREHKEPLTVSEVLLENFSDLNEQTLSANLKDKGLAVGAPLPPDPVAAVRAAVEATLDELYKHNVVERDNAGKKLLELSLRIRPAGANSLKMLVAASPNRLCRGREF